MQAFVPHFRSSRTQYCEFAVAKNGTEKVKRLYVKIAAAKKR